MGRPWTAGVVPISGEGCHRRCIWVRAMPSEGDNSPAASGSEACPGGAACCSGGEKGGSGVGADGNREGGRSADGGGPGVGPVDGLDLEATSRQVLGRIMGLPSASPRMSTKTSDRARRQPGPRCEPSPRSGQRTARGAGRRRWALGGWAGRDGRTVAEQDEAPRRVADGRAWSRGPGRAHEEELPRFMASRRPRSRATGLDSQRAARCRTTAGRDPWAPPGRACPATIYGVGGSP